MPYQAASTLVNDIVLAVYDAKSPAMHRSTQHKIMANVVVVVVLVQDFEESAPDLEEEEESDGEREQRRTLVLSLFTGANLGPSTVDGALAPRRQRRRRRDDPSSSGGGSARRKPTSAEFVASATPSPQPHSDNEEEQLSWELPDDCPANFRRDALPESVQTTAEFFRRVTVYPGEVQVSKCTHQIEHHHCLQNKLIMGMMR